MTCEGSVVSLPSWNSFSDDSLRSFDDLMLPSVFPLHEDMPISSSHDNAYEDWQQRLHDEFFSVQSGYDTLQSSLAVSVHGIGSPSRFPPWDRYRPVVQMAFRSDGTRVRDGGGLSSPLIVDPKRVVEYHWPDPLHKLRTLLQWAVSNSRVKTCISACETVCSSLMRAVESQQADESRIHSLEHTHEAAQMSLKDAVVAAGDAALSRVKRLGAVILDTANPLDFRIADGQPFRLKLLSQLAEACGDCDFEFPLTCEHGVVLGDVEPLPDCLQFPVKSDIADFSAEPIAWSRNYVSAESQPDIVRELIADDLNVENGYARGPFTWRELLAFLELDRETPEPMADSAMPQLGHGIAVVRLGCVDECQYDEHGKCIVRKYRLVCDGTASGVNPRVLLPCVAETPGLLDGEALFSIPCGDHFLVGMKVDVKSAFKRIKVRPDQFSHCVFFFDGAWYVYVVLPFGMKASAYHWVRLYGIIHRLLKRLLQVYFHGSLMYIDDSLYAACQSQYEEVFGIILLMLHILGVPVSWKKVFIGTLLDWVGFRIDFMRERVFLSTLRLAKLRANMHEIDSLRRIPTNKFRKLTFQMVWACQVFPMAKVFLHFFFAVLCSSMAASGFIFRVAKLAHYFALWEELIAAAVTWESAVKSSRLHLPHAVTRTDAMASGEGIFVAGWTAASPEALQRHEFSWFAFQLDPSFFPEAKASPNRMISAAEAAAVALAVAAFGGVLVQSDSMVTVYGEKKWYTGSPNLAKGLTMLVRASVHWKFRPRVDHVPGKENALADALSRMHCDSAAAAHMARCPAALRVPLEVFIKVLPEFDGYLSIPPMKSSEH